MKAIRTYYLGQTNTKPQRIVATTGERGQRLVVSDGDIEFTGLAHWKAAKLLKEKMKWKGAMIGGGFPNGDMVWVFENCDDRA